MEKPGSDPPRASGASTGSAFVPPAVPLGKPRSKSLTVFAVTIGLLALFWMTLVVGILEHRRATFALAEDGANRTAHLLDAYAGLLVGQADKGLLRSQALIEAYLSRNDRSSLNDLSSQPNRLDPLIAEGLAQAPVGGVITIRDADGRLVASSSLSERLVLGATMVEDSLLRRLTAESEPNPLIGRAVDLVGGGQRMLRIARRLRLPDGSLAGVLVLGMPVGVLDQLYLAAEIGPTGRSSSAGATT